MGGFIGRLLGPSRETEVFNAVIYGNTEVASHLVNLEPKLVHAKDKDGWTPLYVAISWGEIEMVKLLIDNGADVNAKNKGITPLHGAAIGGKTDSVMLLIDNGADVNAKDKKYGSTPLYDAAINSNLEIAKILLDNGANVNARDKDGQTLLSRVKNNTDNTDNTDVIKLLCRHGARE
ncbi:MAG: ankyrin repeat domain-containing protein [Candidatus Eremiobacteraeota bacterium]|nr:ankyrin repeat domain-containing protein [Candidatus Eremiobacteraeota bacterium]